MPEIFIRVALDVPLPKLFDYRADDAVDSDIGRRVFVPFGGKKTVGLLLEITDMPDCPPEKIRPALAIDRVQPPLPEDIRRLFRFCASYYHYPIGQIALSALPTALRRWNFQPPPLPLRYRLSAAGLAALPQSLPARAKAQHRLAAALLAGGASRETLAQSMHNAGTILKRWQQAGWLIAEADTPTPGVASHAPELLPGQSAAVRQVTEGLGQYKPFLLHGVTGSGKTEVYLGMVAAALAQGKTTLILVPEIGLTPQFTERVMARFPAVGTSVLHSGLAEGERLQRWRSAAAGQTRIVLGTRLSIFTPMPELGLIIVDEEHDASFAQQEGLRYSARDLAVYRAHQRGIPVVLGSATPSLESWQHVESGKYTRLSLPLRATGAPLPCLELIDTRPLKLDEGLSPPALKAIADTLSNAEQCLVFINRRGYAPVLHCTACAWVAPCHRCSARLTLHRHAHRLRCHHCGHEERIPDACPHCGNPDLLALGQGTQRVEAALQRHFPDVGILRADRDAIRRKGSWEDMLEQIHAGSARLIVGTQLIAKGHDFPNLTLVVVVDADGALFSQDFRAEERLFAQLMQVAGRSGRASKPGRVLIQTAFPDHPLFAQLVEHDYSGFAHAQLALRERGSLPPFSYQAVLRTESTRQTDALAWLQQARELISAPAGVEVFHPVTAPMARKAGYERAQLWLQSTSRVALQQSLADWLPRLHSLPAKQIRWHLDVDPTEN